MCATWPVRVFACVCVSQLRKENTNFEIDFAWQNIRILYVGIYTSSGQFNSQFSFLRCSPVIGCMKISTISHKSNNNIFGYMVSLRCLYRSTLGLSSAFEWHFLSIFTHIACTIWIFPTGIYFFHSLERNHQQTIHTTSTPQPPTKQTTLRTKTKQNQKKLLNTFWLNYFVRLFWGRKSAGNAIFTANIPSERDRASERASVCVSEWKRDCEFIHYEMPNQ